MHPHTPAVPGMPTEPEPIAQVNLGMQVIDSTGADVGTVADVRMPGAPGGAPPDLPPAEADRLVATGYVRVDAAGLLRRDAYLEPALIAEVSETGGGTVLLTVPDEQLTRAG